jgi:hypothetical protein
MSLFPIPASVANQIEKLQRDFLSGMGDEVKFRLVSWSKVCSPISKGVWGFKSCSCSTELLGVSGYSVRLLRERPCREWWWTIKMEVRGVGFWKYIRRVWKEFSRFTRFEVSDNSKISFWKDVWCGKLPFKESFSEWFNIACLRYASMVDLLQVVNGYPQWTVNFVRSALD